MGIVVYHEGAVQAYLSPVQGSLEDATGNGDWFKIGSIGWLGGNKPGEKIWAAHGEPYVLSPSSLPPSPSFAPFHKPSEETQ